MFFNKNFTQDKEVTLSLILLQNYDDIWVTDYNNMISVANVSWDLKKYRITKPVEMSVKDTH